MIDDEIFELRHRLAINLGWFTLLVSAVVIWGCLSMEAFPLKVFALSVAMAIFSFMTLLMLDRYPIASRYLLIAGLLGGLTLAIGWLDAEIVPLLGAPIIFACAMLIPRGAVLSGTVTLTATLTLPTCTPVAPASVPVLLVLVCSIGGTLLVSNLLYTAIGWYRTVYLRNLVLLEQARDHRAQIKSALESLEMAYRNKVHLQQELDWARKQAERAKQLKEQFAANISHELRTPLNLILGFSELMYLSPGVYGDAAEWSPLLRRDIAQIYRSSRHLLEMVDDILDLSRFEIAGFALQTEPTDIHALIDECAELARGLLKGHPIVLAIDLEDELPSVEIDRTRIRQVILNLINNAVRFTDHGTIRVSARTTGRYLEIAVQDTGIGISPDQIDRVFEEFYQVDHAFRRDCHGAGLGLSICKHFVEAHGGVIRAESEPECGSTFVFGLPLTQTWSAGEPLDQPSIARPRARIAVVDTDVNVTRLLSRHIDTHDFLSASCIDDLNALIEVEHLRAAILNNPPNQPHGSVPELAIPVIQCSIPSYSWMTETLGVNAFLCKPVTSEEVIEVTNRFSDLTSVLIIDDDRGFTQLIRRMLQYAYPHLQIQVAYNGQEGLARMREMQPDLVLLDLVMPELGGFQILDIIHTDGSFDWKRVVLLTATSVAEDFIASQRTRVTLDCPTNLRSVEVMQLLHAIVCELSKFSSLSPVNQCPV